MNKGSNQYYPGFPSGFDPQVRKIIEHLWDRINYLIDKVDGLDGKAEIATQGLKEQVSGLRVAVQAAQDAITQGQTFVGFGQTTPISDTASVQISATGVGFSISGPSTGATISVTNAATARGALNAAIDGGVAAHTIVLAAITGGGTNGSITWNGDGTITAFVDPT